MPIPSSGRQFLWARLTPRASLACPRLATVSHTRVAYLTRPREITKPDKATHARRAEDHILNNFSVMGKYRRYFEHRKRSPIEKEKYREERQQQRLQVVPAHESFTHLATPDPVQQDVYANRISKALHNILSGDALPHRTLAAINWTIEKVVLSSDRKHARIWWIPTYHDPNITQERLEGTFEVFGHILERYVNRQLPSKANTKLEFHCAQHLHELMEEVEQQVQTFAQNVRVMSTNDSKPH